MISYAPHFLSTVVVCSMILLFFNTQHGIVSHIKELLGGTSIEWLGTTKKASKCSLANTAYT